MFVGAISDNFDERIEQKIFHAEIVVDVDKVAAEIAKYQHIPTIVDFTDEHGKNTMAEQIGLNYDRIKEEVSVIVSSELVRIKNEANMEK